MSTRPPNAIPAMTPVFNGVLSLELFSAGFELKELRSVVRVSDRDIELLELKELVLEEAAVSDMVREVCEVVLLSLDARSVELLSLDWVVDAKVEGAGGGAGSSE